jgi:uncharacterized protein YeaO (DUF488 family)
VIRLKRVYDKPDSQDGERFLVDRLWPRGLRKEDAHIDGWQKEAGPSNQLRKWFSHDSAKWNEFQRKYYVELDSRPEAWEPLLRAAEVHRVTLLYGSRDPEHNNAAALKRFLEAKLAHKGTRKGL